MTLLSSSVIANRFWHVAQLQNARKHVPRVYFFSLLPSDLKKVFIVNFKGVVQIIYIYIYKSRNFFPISLNMKANWSADPVKTMIHRWKSLMAFICHEWSLFFNPINTPACELHLVYSATSFAAWTRVYCVSKTFEDDLKTNPNNNCMGVSAEFL